MNKYQIYILCLTAQLVSLKARLKAASGYVYNTAMQVECEVLTKQIAALELEIQTTRDEAKQESEAEKQKRVRDFLGKPRF